MACAGRGSPSAFSVSRVPVLWAPHETGVLSAFVVEAGQCLTLPRPITGHRTALLTPPDHSQRKTTASERHTALPAKDIILRTMLLLLIDYRNKATKIRKYQEGDGFYLIFSETG
ncbi:hypothetical protein NDU88_002890 [Pleurodeles waltl]|uniref:Uncharacterized protein n=1 Tax=Pleurodeles waltl TaxID=8319 RepID=A0AAV7VFW1_PLEWA|nr:hypothetical protein NDU88_002890 [Pleurodeles waltl]